MTGADHSREAQGRLRLEHLWALIVLAGILAFLNTSPIRPHDFWWHMQAGREIVATGHIPAVDTLSFTASGRPYVYWIYWLMELALYLVYSVGGTGGVIVVNSLLITAAYGLLLWLCRRLAQSWQIAAACTLLAAALGFTNWNVRPQTMAFPLVALFLWAIYSYRQQPRRRWLIALPLGMLLWVNSHGSFFLGLLLIGIWLADEGWQFLRGSARRESRAQVRRLVPPALALAACSAACLVNPQGYRIVMYVKTMATAPVIQNLILEWMPPSPREIYGLIFMVSLLLSATVLMLSPRRPSFFQVLTFLIFGGLGLNTTRSTTWFGMVMAPVLAEHLPLLVEQARQSIGQAWGGRLAQLSGGRPAPPTVQRILNYTLAALVLIGVVGSLPWFKDWIPLRKEKAGMISAETPIEATQFLLRERLPNPIFNDMSFGSYLIWAAQPDYPVFVDPRIDLYPAKIWVHYLEISAAQYNWEERLNEYGVKTLMLRPDGQGALIQAARRSPNWQPVYEDPYAVIFCRTD